MPPKRMKRKVPPGFNLRHTLEGQHGAVTKVAWSSDGKFLASPSEDCTIRVWDADNGKLQVKLEGHTSCVFNVAWSPDRRTLASSSGDNTIRIWDVEIGKLQRILRGHSDSIYSLAWSPDGHKLASGSSDKTIRLWDANTGKLHDTLRGHVESVGCVTWSPNGTLLASASSDSTIRIWDTRNGKLRWVLVGHKNIVEEVLWSPREKMITTCACDSTIRLWNPQTGQQLRILEGPQGPLISISYSADGRLLASNSYDGAVTLWRCDNWRQLAPLDFGFAFVNLWAGLAFSPVAPILATVGEVIRIWDIDLNVLLDVTTAPPTVHYSNARVILLGESGTGKTCLARALMRETFKPQESTHGMNVWTFQSETVKRPDGSQITRETLLWDLAGQIDYQVVNQLFLDETALGIVLFDPAHPENPFGGVGHWEKALRRVVGEKCPRLLVAGRVDRGHPTVILEEIDAFCEEHGFADFVATSAKTREGLEELRAAIARTVPWDNLPVTTSPELWRNIREYLIKRRAGRYVLTTRANLRTAFRRKHKGVKFTEADFDTVISHAQAQGLVWRLSFGDYVLMRPELLNSYAGVIVRAARRHSKGLGTVKERDVIEARIDFGDMKRLRVAEKERSLFHAVVELFLAREVALREGEHLVFPSKFNRKLPEHSKPPLREVAYNFAGPVENIYATLVTRLFYSGAFELKDLWKYAAEFRCAVGRICGFQMEIPEEGQGVISVFFEKRTSIDTKVLFLQFIHEHLQKRALIDSVKRERIYRCPKCGEEVENRRAVEIRLKDRKKNIPCLFCDEKIQLIDLLEEKFGDPELLQRTRELEEKSKEMKTGAVGMTTASAKEEIGETDVFLSYNSKDKRQVEGISEELKRRGLNSWLDKEQIPPGRLFQDLIQKEIPRVKSAAIFIGPYGLGKWQVMELRTFISQCVERNVPVIPVLLPGVSGFPEDLLFLRELHYVCFNESVHETEAIDDLVWGITGEHPQRKLR